jgi:hypothetical protein
MACPSGWNLVVAGTPLTTIQAFSLLAKKYSTSVTFTPVGFDHDGKLKPANKLRYKKPRRERRSN